MHVLARNCFRLNPPQRPLFLPHGTNLDFGPKFLSHTVFKNLKTEFFFFFWSTAPVAAHFSAAGVQLTARALSTHTGALQAGQLHEGSPQPRAG